MVVFTCQHCGDPVKKAAVEKHYSTKCRFRSPNLTCVDCLKDFSCEDYGSHNQCMTEAQRYSAQGTVFKEQKGKKKQEKYIEVIQKILNSKHLTLSDVQRQLLDVCSNHDNVPRKVKPFNNFVNNVARNIRCKEKDIHIVFNIIEETWKKETQPESSLAPEKKDQGKETTDLQEVTNSKGKANNKINEDITDDKIKSEICTKNKKKKLSDKSLILDDGLDSMSTEKTCSDGKEFTNDQVNFKPKKTKKKFQNDNNLSVDEADETNKGSSSESIKEDNGDMLSNESKKAKKENLKRKSLCSDNENVANPELEDGISNGIDLKNSTIDDTKENVNKVSKKQLKKQKKYEKYLAELENESKFEVDENPMNAEGEESINLKKNSKKNKKLKADKNESESLGLTEDKNAVNVKYLPTKADSKKMKKRKLEDCVGETPEKKIKENSEEGVNVSAVAVFNWGDVIVRALNSRPEKELSLKKLGKKVVNEYQAVKPDHRTYEELLAKFNKKVNKVKGVRVLRDRAKLIDEPAYSSPMLFLWRIIKMVYIAYLCMYTDETWYVDSTR